MALQVRLSGTIESSLTPPNTYIHRSFARTVYSCECRHNWENVYHNIVTERV
jgi:hypothetical protein